MVDLGREEKNSPERQGVRVRKPALGNESVGREAGVETFQKIPEQRERLEGWRRDKRLSGNRRGRHWSDGSGGRQGTGRRDSRLVGRRDWAEKTRQDQRQKNKGQGALINVPVLSDVNKLQ